MASPLSGRVPATPAGATSSSVSSREQQQQLETSVRRTPAPYGQACLNCVKAKCKCILVNQPGFAPNSGDPRLPCERCARLGRECQPPTGVRKLERSASKRRGGGGVAPPASRGSTGLFTARRTANIEQRLDDLVVLLTAQASGAPKNPDGQLGDDELPRHAQIAKPESEVHMAASASSPTQASISVPTPATISLPASVPASVPASLPSLLNDDPMSPAQATETLDFFRQYYLKFFPFLYIPPGVDAAQIQRNRPFLWLAISAVCCKSPVRQAALSRKILEQLAHKMLITCERNIDMLLGTLCALGWTMYLCVKPVLGSIMSMATSIVADLRLDKPDYEPGAVYCYKSNDFVTPLRSAVRTMEERRATLACYAYCSSGASLLKCQSMRWTGHMEESLKILAEKAESEGDLMLVFMVRIRRLTESLYQTHAAYGAEDGGTGGRFKPPANSYVKFFLQDLQKIKDEMPQVLWDNWLATSLILSAEMVITDLPFYHPTNSGSMLELPTRPGAFDSRNMDIGRVEASFAVLQTTAAFLKHFLTFELADLVGFSFPVILTFFRALQIIYRLQLWDYPGWDRQVVSDNIDIFAVVDHMVNNYDKLPELYGFLGETDADGNDVPNFYAKCSRMLGATLVRLRTIFPQGDASRPRSATNNSRDTDAIGRATTSEISPPTTGSYGAESNSNMDTRGNYPTIYSTVNSPNPFPTDFQLDDAWYNEVLFSLEPHVFSPAQSF